MCLSYTNEFTEIKRFIKYKTNLHVMIMNENKTITVTSGPYTFLLKR